MKLDKINLNKQNNNPSFKSTNPFISNTLSGGAKLADLFIRSQENLSSTRFIQDTATNWLPKAIFSRSKADFAEMSFLEFLESGIFYFASPILGEKLFRNVIFKNFQPKNLKNAINEQIPKSLKEITTNPNLSKAIKNNAIASKAGIILACTAIPIAEYTLSFAKNLFTLKAFKKSNFNNIANLDKGKAEKEDKKQQQQVEKSAKSHLKKAAVLSLAGVAAGSILALKGAKSDKLINLSKAIIEPGQALSKGISKLGIKNEKLNNTLSKFSLDFSNNNGKLALGKGQLALTAILGLFGYSKAASDRGKLDVAEVWTRVPLVVFYTIFGSELFEKGFINILNKLGKCKDLIKKDAKGNISIPKRTQLPEIAQKLAKQNKTLPENELNKLVKQKAFTTGVPYAFSLLFMGFTLSAITRLWTQYRYNKQNKETKNDTLIFLGKNLPEAFKSFSK